MLEPTVFSRLKGDYRSGKRLSMRRVLEYVASGYRKDKIWLRRNRPAKRAYQVLVAIDDSASMRDNGAHEAALAALAALAAGLAQLEVGDLAVARFGDAAELLHGFADGPLGDDAAARCAARFAFADEATRCAALLETALPALRAAREAAARQAAPLQLLLLVSDGRFDAPSRAELRRLQRDATDDGVAIVVLLIDAPGRESVLEMKSVSFVDGQVAIDQYMDGYPFPCYVVLRDVAALPDTLATALKQWFEFHAR